MTAEEAEILVDWAEEYGINSHRPMTHPERGGHWKDKLHIGIMKWHIEVIDS